ncbi:UDP-3-O-acyl-N-acetylglucosamine deacetylase [Celeribacter marinus]|uniref:UDP-3-O-acyl-N-acetylglucosamine deacetylase n=1 Tax=Celeribacter marinus TaxID=1397108 RepID=A0A0N9ZDC4_9RHOB|nr:UDP-3-O-acyl-N-acetylglucosamine deacetylase [Celeribacter marinus]ALI54762.1 UDP-3-O-[3-hydroxymyristoyl]N-acetylglucosamine deacetylase [Celeribacter marinus]SFK55785.1 UDP-3-O-[3-hydroxymyristoyl] N-acetylglucosamine deacetylase [Celeribacter marinus]
MQTTLVKPVIFDGVGLHSGAPVRMVVSPARVNAGITFVRSDVAADVADDRACEIAARWDHVVPSQLCTLMRNEDGVTLSTVEHIMAALAGLGVNNAVVSVDGPEVPILDGSAAPFVEKLLSSGLAQQDGPARVLKVLKPVVIEQGDAVARLEPADTMEIDFHIDFDDAAIGVQGKRLSMANGAFVRELSDCRTFCRKSDVDVMRQNGLALGGTFENAVVVDGDAVLSPGGLRRDDEPVRHKMLDALGDLYLAGAPVLGRYVGQKAGHAMTNALLRKLFATKGAWAFVTVDAKTAARLPGAGVTRSDLAVCA